ncbi:hypothetical protein C8Q74DRAFT_1219646 [Fomes fomentarius]|nr:hypothetical protein C8Q74DRAFT_1219646 [Fomes fomentarius]
MSRQILNSTFNPNYFLVDKIGPIASDGARWGRRLETCTCCALVLWVKISLKDEDPAWPGSLSASRVPITPSSRCFPKVSAPRKSHHVRLLISCVHIDVGYVLERRTPSSIGRRVRARRFMTLIDVRNLTARDPSPSNARTGYVSCCASAPPSNCVTLVLIKLRFCRFFPCRRQNVWTWTASLRDIDVRMFPSLPHPAVLCRALVVAVGSDGRCFQPSLEVQLCGLYELSQISAKRRLLRPRRVMVLERSVGWAHDTWKDYDTIRTSAHQDQAKSKFPKLIISMKSTHRRYFCTSRRIVTRLSSLNMGRPAPAFPGELMFSNWEKRVDT